MKNRFFNLCCSFSPSLISPDLGAVRCASPSHSLCVGSWSFLLILPSAPQSSSCSRFILRSAHRNPPVRFHFPLCDFILVTHTDSCKQAQRAAILLPISFSRSCAPVTFPDSRTSAQGEVFLPTEATAAVFDFCRRRQDLDFVSFCSVLASSAKLLCWWLSSGEVLQLQTVVRRTTCFFFYIVC
jgi:hypothetical protein